MSSPTPPRRRIRLGPGGEFDLIRAFLASGGELPPEVSVGPGDDAAVLTGGPWAVTCDLSVEDVHFRRDWMSAEEIGYRAAAVTLSDLAGMAADPVAVLVACAAPRADMESGMLETVQDGVRRAVEGAGAAVVGGDVTGSPGPLVLDVTGLGRAPRPVLRSGALPGDEVWVTGRLGGSAAGVRILEAGDTPSPALRRAYVHPVPRVREALWLADRLPLHALIDLSDGLGGDAGHLAAASGVAVVLDPDALPEAEGVEAVAPGRDERLELLLGGGEDYELCLVAPAGAVEEVAEAFGERFGVGLTRVGRVESGEGVLLARAHGAPVPLERGGFDHFAPGH